VKNYAPEFKVEEVGLWWNAGIIPKSKCTETEVLNLVSIVFDRGIVVQVILIREIL